MFKNQTIININSLLDLTARLYESDSESFILNATLLSLMGKLKILRAFVIIPDSEDNFIPFLIKGNVSIGNIPKFNITEFTKIRNAADLSQLSDYGVEYAVPVRNAESLFAVICLGKSLTEYDLQEEEIDYINLISNIAANSISNAHNLVSFKNAKFKAEQRNQLLSTLFEITKDFSLNYSPDQIVKTLALNLMGQLTVSRFAVFTIDGNSEITPIVNRFGENFDNDILAFLTNCDFAQRIKDFGNLNEFEPKVNKLHIQVVAPMVVQGTRRGLLIIGRKMNGADFTEENLMFIEALGNSAISAIENERLFREELEKKRIESELGIALEIQKNLLPDKSPELKNFNIAGISIPSRHVGGDLYDYIRLDDNRYLLAIADVSGKGIPASLIMANFQAALRVLAMSGLPLNEIVVKINNLLYHNTSPDKFVTSFFCIIDDYHGTLAYINAGHNPPFLKRKNGGIEMLTTGGLILGFMEFPFEFQEAEVHFENDDYLIMYTDGVTEAENSSKTDYGEKRLEEFMNANSSNVPEVIMNELIKSVNSYLDGAPQNDDITLIVLNKL